MAYTRYIPCICQEYSSNTLPGRPVNPFCFCDRKRSNSRPKWRRASECVNARCATSALHNSAPHSPLHTAQWVVVAPPSVACGEGGGPRRAGPHPDRCISLARGLGPVQASTAKNQHRRSHSWSFSTVSLDQPVPTQLPYVPMLITRQWNGVTGAWGLELPSGEQSGPRAQNQPPSRWHPASARPPGPTPARAGTHCASSISMQQQQDAAAAGCSSRMQQQHNAAAAQCSSSTMQQQHDAAAARYSSSTIQQQCSNIYQRYA